jgi:dTDP-4-amino-4,6-dideoxygalactose transaminase
MPPWPHCTEAEIEAVTAVLRSGKLNYWTGEEGRQFEKDFAAYVGRKYAVAMANGTVALEAALWALGVGRGDEVVVPSRTFIASASCVVMRGGVPVIADVDADSQTITETTIKRVLSARTRAIIAVHLAGWPCDMDPILHLARERGIHVIEDCAQCHGAHYRRRPAGSLGDVGAFSFCQDKILTTCGEGGMLVTDDPAVYEHAWSFKDHGKNLLASHEQKSNRIFRFVHDSFGTNWRMTEVQAAAGRVRLRSLDAEVAIRRRNARILIDHLQRMPSLRVPTPDADFEHSYYKFSAFVRPELLRTGWSRDRIVTAINVEGIPCFSGICSEIYLERAFQGIRPPRRMEVARKLGETSLTFQVHPTLEPADMLDTCAAVEKVMQAASSSVRANARIA